MRKTKKKQVIISVLILLISAICLPITAHCDTTVIVKIAVKDVKTGKNILEYGKDSINAHMGHTQLTLTANSSKSYNITTNISGSDIDYSTSDPNVLTFEDGRLCAHHVGEASITMEIYRVKIPAEYNAEYAQAEGNATMDISFNTLPIIV